ncbi:hypothetical protein PR202_gb04628 [Eleusine coracana subsp. coracana]|uniref:BSD domain-containing protein n=1 Tax=Eleusine coracana subsp. coracana TaxID=191504 RepID=A0AAV5E5Q6_ELECO|nr:hypothetical protein PR202_gb04628 [Eleusine coracana subsp. coracana]
MATTLTPMQCYATGALLELTLRQTQIHQCAHLGDGGGSEPDDEERASSDAASDTDLWMQDSCGLLRPVFRFLEIEPKAWVGLEEMASSPEAKHHIRALCNELNCCYLPDDFSEMLFIFNSVAQSDNDAIADVDMTDGRQDHALAVERVAPELADLRIELCPIHMREGCFWMIYFVLMDPRLTKEDAEILSTLQGETKPIKSYSHRYPTPYMASGSTAPYWFSIKRASAYIIIRASYGFGFGVRYSDPILEEARGHVVMDASFDLVKKDACGYRAEEGAASIQWRGRARTYLP